MLSSDIFEPRSKDIIIIIIIIIFLVSSSNSLQKSVSIRYRFHLFCVKEVHIPQKSEKKYH